MPDDVVTMADMVADGLDLSPAEVTDLTNSVKFLDALGWEKSSNGETHKYTKETGAPVVGFREANRGRALSKSQDTLVTATLEICDLSYRADKAIADIWRKGGAGAWIAREGLRHIKASMKAAERQLIYGNSNLGDAAGFLGMINSATGDALADGMVVDATGSTANAAASVWVISAGPNDLQAVYNGDNPFDLGDPTVIDALDDQGNHYPAYYVPGTFWMGMQLGSIYSMARICNLTAQAGKGLTDTLIGQAVSLFPSGHEPTHILTNRRSREQLRVSRTATTPTGIPATTPKDWDGIPIIPVESLVNTEAIVA